MTQQEGPEHKATDEALRIIAASARCILWYADVEECGEPFLRWHITLADEEAAQRFFPLEVPPGGTYAVAFSHSRLREDKARMDVYGEGEARAGRDYRQEFRCRRADGEVRWFAEEVQIQTLAPGRWRAVGVCMDITERKLLEQALRESELRYSTLAEAVPEILFTNTPDGGTDYCSQRFYDYTGIDAGQALGFGWLAALHPEDMQGTVARWMECVRSVEPFDVEFRLRRADGVYRWFRSRSLPIRDADGRVSKWSGVCMDIDDQKRLEQELQQQAAALAASDRRKDEFLAMLAHELRNPLGAISNAAQVLQMRESGEPILQRQREVITRQTRHVSRLVDDLMDVSRITRGQIELRSEILPLRTVLESALATARPEMERRRHQVLLHLAEEPILAAGDAMRLEQVFTNILANAAKFTPDEGTIAVTLLRENEEGVLRIRDSGRGIEPELLPRVFDLFTQGDQASDRSSGGLGIGLTLAKRIVELHGGKVTALSPGPGMGSEFVVRLPVLPPMAASPDAVTADRRDAADSAAGRRVLVVEDNVDAAETLADVLEELGYQVRVRLDGSSALEAAREEEPELMLLDIGLPGMDGYEVARCFRREFGSGPLVVALTGYGQEEDRQRSKEAGIDVHLTKPVNVTELDRILAAARGTERAEA